MCAGLLYFAVSCVCAGEWWRWLLVFDTRSEKAEEGSGEGSSGEGSSGGGGGLNHIGSAYSGCTTAQKKKKPGIF